MCGASNYRNHGMSREQVYEPTEPSFPIPLKKDIDVVRNKKQIGNLQRGIDDLGNSDGKRTLSESWSAAPRFRILNKGPPQGDSRVDGRLTKTQVTSRPEMIRPEVLSSMSKCAQQKQSSNEMLKNPK